MAKYSPEEKKKLRGVVLDIIAQFKQGVELEALCQEAGFSVSQFYGYLALLKLGGRYREAKNIRERATEGREAPKEQSLAPIHQEQHPTAPSTVGMDDTAICRAILEHYLYSQLAMVDCIKLYGMNESKFYIEIAESDELTEYKEEVKELRVAITAERLAFDKEDSLNHTTKEAFRRIREGTVSMRTKTKVRREEIFDTNGNAIGDKVLTEEETMHDRAQATVAELSLAARLLSIGKKQEHIPESAVAADSIEFDLSELPDLVDEMADENLESDE